MATYMFVIDAVPDPTNKDCEDIAGAKVHVWVISNDIESAKNIATAHIVEYKWQPVSFGHEFEMLPEQILDQHEDEILLYEKALLHGVAADFLAWPKKQGKRTDPVVMRKL